jgi:hypothetical protein
VKGVPKWRLACGLLVLAALGFFAAILAPLYLHAFELHEYVSSLKNDVDNRDRSEDGLVRMVLAKSRSLNLPVTASGVQITRSGGDLRIDVHYRVKVDLPGYTVELHF